MTDKEQLMEIRTEIERRAKILSGTHAGRSSDVLPVLEELLSIIESMQDSSQQCGDCVRWDKKKGCILESHNTHCITDAACESYKGSTQASKVSSNITFKVLSKSKFKAGDHIKPIDKCLGSPRIIEEVCDGWYVTNLGTLDFEFEDNWELVEEPAGLDKGKLMDMLEDSLSKETKESWNEILDKDEEPVSDDLEEEVHNFPLHYHGDIVTDEDGIHLCDINESKLLEIAHHFANWQKQQMMKDAFTAEVNWYENAVIMCQSLDGFIKEKGWHKGDKVKLILIKDE